MENSIATVTRWKPTVAPLPMRVYCGQYLYADLTSGTVVAHFSVSDQVDGFAYDHFSNIWEAASQITRL